MSKKTYKNNEKFKNDLKQVQDQYLDYPYPFRNPKDEKHRLVMMQGDSIAEINHYLFRGKQDFSHNFRVLVAGGGTGDAAIYWAEQLRNTNSQVVYLDFSKASMQIAKERAKIRKLDNIKWYNDSLLNLPKMNIGKFDLINCVGVLHHLSDPDEGLKCLKSVLKPQGGMSLMVYAKYGRTGLYQIQDLMRIINESEISRQKEVENCWGIVKALPPTNLFKKDEQLLSDHLHDGDIGLYDMFLHKQDRAYSIPEIYEFVSKAGLNFVEFSDNWTRAALNIRSFLPPGELIDKILKMDKIKQQTICEIMVSNITKHSFWVTNENTSTIASFDDFNNIPYFIEHVYGNDILSFLEKTPECLGSPLTLNMNYWGKPTSINIIISELTKYMFEAQKPGTKTLAEILEHVKQCLGRDVTEAEFKNEIDKVFMPLVKAGPMYLRHKSVNVKITQTQL